MTGEQVQQEVMLIPPQYEGSCSDRQVFRSARAFISSYDSLFLFGPNLVMTIQLHQNPRDLLVFELSLASRLLPHNWFGHVFLPT